MLRFRYKFKQILIQRIKQGIFGRKPGRLNDDIPKIDLKVNLFIKIILNFNNPALFKIKESQHFSQIMIKEGEEPLKKNMDVEKDSRSKSQRETITLLNPTKLWCFFV